MKTKQTEVRCQRSAGPNVTTDLSKYLGVTLLACVSLLSVTSSTFAASVVASINSGGGYSSSAAYGMDSSVGNIAGDSSGGSVKNMAGGTTTRPTTATNLVMTATPASVYEGGTSHLGGTVTMDDLSIMPLNGTDIAWGSVTYPFQSIASNGVLVAANSVYASVTGTVSGSYLGLAGNTSAQVLGPYASSGIPELWFVQYFGAPPNTNAAPDYDADGTGQNNLFKYIAGLDPTNPASIFTLRIASAANQPGQATLIYNPVAGGRTYTPQYSTNLASLIWPALNTVTAVQTNGTQATVTDMDASQASKFYRINISLP